MNHFIEVNKNFSIENFDNNSNLISKFKLFNVQPSDAGNYTCKPTSAEPATIKLFVKSSYACPPPFSLVLTNPLILTCSNVALTDQIEFSLSHQPGTNKNGNKDRAHANGYQGNKEAQRNRQQQQHNYNIVDPLSGLELADSYGSSASSGSVSDYHPMGGAGQMLALMMNWLVLLLLLLT